MKVVIFTSSAYTGGPFALMQLYLELRLHSIDCEMVYYDAARLDFDRGTLRVSYPGSPPHPLADLSGLDEIPEYAKEINAADCLVLPEVLLELSSSLHGAGFNKILFWWLSWDNADLSKINRLDIANALNASRHIFQSHYAREQARRFGFDGWLVGDWTLVNGIDDVSRSPSHKSVDFCYFEKKSKGAERAVNALRSKFEVVVAKGMSQIEVHSLLARSKVFLDFGHHPGKDRMPREAVLYDCIPVVRRAGAANYHSDVPLPNELKLAADQMSSPEFLVKYLEQVILNSERFKERLHPYRQMVLRERDVFSNQVAVVVEFVLRGELGFD